MPHPADDMTSAPPAAPGQQQSPAPRSRVVERFLARAKTEWAQGQLAQAEQSLAKVLALAADDADGLRMLGMVTQRRGNQAKAIECFSRVLAVWPKDSDLRVWLGIALYEHGDTAQAVTHLRRACQLAPASALAWFNLGEALSREAYTAEAVEALRRAATLDPTHLAAHLSLARVLANLGQVDAAIAAFREVLRNDPGNADGWFGLSNLNIVHFDTADLACLQRALGNDRLPARERELLGFTCAKALEDQGNYTSAFEAFADANASRRERVHWDAAGERRRVDAIMRVFADAPAQPVDATRGDEAIFITSIPRSGSTLVEQILASHSQVEGANEIKDLTQVIDAETARRHSAFPLWVPEATAPDWQRLGSEYLERTERWRRTKPRFTDKSLVSWYLVGAALAMLPKARVVIVRRDPVETCLACFRQCFAENAGFACDLDEMADYCIDFLRLTRFWLERYPTRVFDLEYETLVAEPEPMIRRLLDFCDLPFEPACLEFHKTPRSVLSLPSAAQVRQPIRHDTARSARYGSKLDRLRQRLREAGIVVD